MRPVQGICLKALLAINKTWTQTYRVRAQKHKYIAKVPKELSLKFNTIKTNIQWTIENDYCFIVQLYSIKFPYAPFFYSWKVFSSVVTIFIVWLLSINLYFFERVSILSTFLGTLFTYFLPKVICFLAFCFLGKKKTLKGKDGKYS